MRRSTTSQGLFFAVLLAACGSTAEEPATTTSVTTTSASALPGGEPTLRKIPLRPGARITIEALPDGSTSIRVHVPEGMGIPPGDYTSSSPHLVEEFRAVQETLGQPGNAAWMHVDDRGEIVTVSRQVTLQ